MAGTVGVLGLGRMGLPIARRLGAAGFAVSGFDTDQTRLAAVGLPMRPASSASDLVSHSDILVTVLPGPTEFRDAFLGPDGILSDLVPGSLVIDLTSNDPRIAAEVTIEAERRGIDVVGAPMGGGPPQAATGQLTFFVSGGVASVERATTVLDALGHADVVGPRTQDGYIVKLLANLLWFGQAAAVTEALLLGQSLGIEVRRLRDVLGTSAAGSAFIDRHLDLLLAGDYAETFGLDRVVEELDTVSSLARGTGTPFTVSAEVAALHHQALDRFGPIDGELLVARLLEDRAGSQLRAPSGHADVIPDGRE